MLVFNTLITNLRLPDLGAPRGVYIGIVIIVVVRTMPVPYLIFDELIVRAVFLWVVEWMTSPICRRLSFLEFESYLTVWAWM